MSKASRARLIAQELTTLVNSIDDADLSIPKTEWTAERAYVAYYQGEKLEDLKVRLYPDGKGSDGDSDRELDIVTYSVSLAVVQNVKTGLSRIDLLIDFVEQLHDFILDRSNRQIDNTATELDKDLQICAELSPPFEIDPIIDQKVLHEDKIFVSRTFL